jgi:hypothetical protein
MARGSGNGTDSSLKHAHSSLEDGVGWVAHTGVDIAVLGPGELVCTIRGVGKVV